MKKFTPNTLNKLDIQPFILVGAVVVILIISFIIFFYPTDKPSDDLDDILLKLKELESKILILEEKNDISLAKVNTLNETLKNFSETSETMQAMPVELENIQKKINHLDKRQGNLERKIAGYRAARPKIIRSAKTEVKKTSTSKSVKYHIVADGDTLYSIARHYGITVDHLRKLNKLSSEAILQLNQKLIVGY